MYYSPLRYPGGKAKLSSFMEFMIEQSGHRGGTYIEPFAGGAGIAIELLQKGTVSQIVINDYDKGVWSFWKAMLTETSHFIENIRSVPLTIEEWERQRSICINNNVKYSFELGFATFYMNRTNRSGIIKGGVIGGFDQSGDWKLDARFPRESLVQRVEKIAEKKNSIKLYNKDINSFIERYLPLYEDNSFIYFDPPYFQKGKQLYMNYFEIEDHKHIEKSIKSNVKSDWIITYDFAPEIESIYSAYPMKLFDINYSVSKKCKASELMIFKNDVYVPSDNVLRQNNININLRDVKQGIE